MTWNPNAPLSLGAQWYLDNYGTTVLNNDTDNVALVVDSSATETITGLVVPHYWPNGGSGYGRLIAEIYDIADLGEAQTELTVTLLPNEDKFGGSGASQNQSGAFTNLYQSIDDATAGANDADWIGLWSNTGSYRCQFDTSVLPSGMRPLAVYFDIRVYAYYSGPGLVLGVGPIDVNWYNGATDKGKMGTYPTTFLNINAWQDYSIGPFYIDPDTNLPWTRKSLLDLDDNTKVNVRLGMQWGSSPQISRFAMRVVYAAAEKRLAIGGATVQTTAPAGLQTNLTMTLSKPLDGAASWAKVSGTDYLVLLRRIAGPVTTSGATLVPSVPYLESDDNNPHGQGLSRVVTLLGTNGQILGITAVNLPKTYPIDMIVGGAMAADSEVYHSLTPKPLHASSTLTQRFGNASAGQIYDKVRTLLALNLSAGVGGFGVTVKIKRASDDVQMGGTGTILYADVGDPVLEKDGYSYYDVTVQLASGATLAAATTYYIEFTAPSTPSFVPWYVGMLDYTESNSITGDESFGGATFYATVATVQQSGDFIAVVASTPAAITGVDAEAISTAIPDNGDSACCQDCERCSILVTWTQTAVAEADFGSYEIQRSDDNATFETIGYVTDFDGIEFEDVEITLGIPQYYRVRQIRADGIVSDWSSVASGSCGLDAEGDLIYFTSNVVPELSTAYVRLNPEHVYNFLSAAEVKLLRLYNRDYQAEFRPLENRGVSFPIEVLIFNQIGGTPPGGKGVRAFNTLRSLIENEDVAYICLQTSDGEKFYGSVILPEGRRSEPGSNYVASLVFTQTTDSPTPATRTLA